MLGETSEISTWSPALLVAHASEGAAFPISIFRVCCLSVEWNAATCCVSECCRSCAKGMVRHSRCSEALPHASPSCTWSVSSAQWCAFTGSEPCSAGCMDFLWAIDGRVVQYNSHWLARSAAYHLELQPHSIARFQHLGPAQWEESDVPFCISARATGAS